MRVLGVIPARGGSKGIARKNLAALAGRPLLAYTADAVHASRLLTRAIVSTEDPDIAAAAQGLSLDVPFLRPAALAADDTPMLPVVQHALQAMQGDGAYDAVVLLQPTSPLRRGEHIDAAIALLKSSGADSVVTVVEVPHQYSPLSALRIEDGRLRPVQEGPKPTRRQDKPRVYARNGPAVLAVKASVVEAGSLYGDDSRPLVMAMRDSHDIDSADDLELVELLLSRR
jgi:CMP-N,N'-diacetyllegionaminic acid synthase